jgi:hypothetical protein
VEITSALRTGNVGMACRSMSRPGTGGGDLKARLCPRRHSMQRIEPRELHERMQKGTAYVLDVRSEKAFGEATEHIPGDVRHSPDHLEGWRVPGDRTIVTYCT